MFFALVLVFPKESEGRVGLERTHSYNKTLLQFNRPVVEYLDP